MIINPGNFYVIRFPNGLSSVKNEKTNRGVSCDIFDWSFMCDDLVFWRQK